VNIRAVAIDNPDMVLQQLVDKPITSVSLEHYRATPLTDDRADQAIMQTYRSQVIDVRKIADVLKRWEEPEHDWGDKTGWRLFTAATFALTGRVSESPKATADLHRILDLTCEHVG
jgi:hypothetical protein